MAKVTKKDIKTKEEKAVQNEYVDNIKDEFYQRVSMLIHKEESRLVSCMWQTPELFLETELTYADFHNNDWATVFYIGYDLVRSEGVKCLQDPQVIDSYLTKHKKCAKVWESIDGDNTFLRIKDVSSLVNVENYQNYVLNFQKLNAILKLVNKGMAIINDKTLSMYMDMSVDEIYEKYEHDLNQIFSTSFMPETSYDIYDNIEKHIDEWDRGEAMGLIMNGLENFSADIGGIPDSGISLIGGISNAGKSSLVRNTIVPIMIPPDEELEEYKKYKKEEEENPDIDYEYILNNKTVIFMNEEGLKKWQRELLIWVINNKILVGPDKKISKTVLVRGGFKDKKENGLDYMKWMKEAIKWMKIHIPKGHIQFIPLEKFSTRNTIKLIRQYATRNYKNFIIDTFKMDNTDDAKIDSNARLQLVQNMTHLYNLAKEDGGKNLRIICTVQLSKAYTLQRYLSQECLAESKNIIDVCSLGIFIRTVWQDELAGGTKELNYHKYGDPITTYTLPPNFNYILLFPVKTREGSVSRQCVARVDWSNNIIEELGYVELSPSI